MKLKNAGVFFPRLYFFFSKRGKVHFKYYAWSLKSFESFAGPVIGLFTGVGKYDHTHEEITYYTGNSLNN